MVGYGDGQSVLRHQMTTLVSSIKCHATICIPKFWFSRTEVSRAGLDTHDTWTASRSEVILVLTTSVMPILHCSDAADNSV